MLKSPSNRVCCLAAAFLSLGWATSCSTDSPTASRVGKIAASDSTPAPISSIASPASAVASNPGSAKASGTGGASEPLKITFAGTPYYFRFSEGGLYEFTPEGQDDLDRWTDMLSVNTYSNVDNAKSLAETAFQVVANYHLNMGKILELDSSARTPQSTNEHLIVAVFPRPDFSEFVQARFLLAGNVGMSVIHCHRVYGRNTNDEMIAWVEENGSKSRRALMSCNPPSDK